MDRLAQLSAQGSLSSDHVRLTAETLGVHRTHHVAVDVRAQVENSSGAAGLSSVEFVAIPHGPVSGTTKVLAAVEARTIPVTSAEQIPQRSDE